MLRNLAVPMILYLLIVVMITAYFRPRYRLLYHDSGEQSAGYERRLLGTQSESDWETRMANIHQERRTALDMACQKFNMKARMRHS
ncbi:Hypp1676 [Branchiostoma lanceolatum]|nr:Hypp1676 [Branchiostoma lanceolatum]